MNRRDGAGVDDEVIVTEPGWPTVNAADDSLTPGPLLTRTWRFCWVEPAALVAVIRR